MEGRVLQRALDKQVLQLPCQQKRGFLKLERAALTFAGDVLCDSTSASYLGGAASTLRDV